MPYWWLWDQYMMILYLIYYYMKLFLSWGCWLPLLPLMVLKKLTVKLATTLALLLLCDNLTITTAPPMMLWLLLRLRSPRAILPDLNRLTTCIWIRRSMSLTMRLSLKWQLYTLLDKHIRTSYLDL